VSWYCCGPTVYSHSHLGHARCYVVFDAMRRVLERRFGVNVRFALNITDVDDKIIHAANAAGSNYADFALFWEADFFEKMHALNVRLPDAVVRVSDFIPEIITYIEQIQANGFAYQTNSGVYFDVEKFRKAGFEYCQLMPSAFNDENLAEAGEPKETSEKRNPVDFALWKLAKPNEPFWPSKWGKGRPGWHIECSALIKEIFGNENKLDVHSGGSDLKFPHHDNEIAQGEAHDCTKGWVDYFIHCAPLAIRGLKMSKSLKNFITIDEALKQVSGRQLRLYLLLHKYTTTMNFDPDSSYTLAKEKDKYLAEFFSNLQHDLEAKFSMPSTRLKSQEKDLDNLITEASIEIREALANNFDTGAALGVVFKAAKAYNVAKQGGIRPSVTVLSRLHELASSLASDLGLDYSPRAAGERLPAAEETVGPLVAFRRQVVDALRCRNIKSAFAACDRVRDEVLPRLGVKVEDGKDGFRLVDPLLQPQVPETQNEQSSPGAQEFEEKSPANPPKEGARQLNKSPTELGQALFGSPRYAKFKIGAIGQDGLPIVDLDGQAFPSKVMDRFRRDLQRELDQQTSKES
jgi:cysteinyl-tRNA synthetase